MANHNDNNNKDRDKHLFYLNELSDYKVAGDDPDVRGWKVKDSDNRVLGKVDNLLVNKKTEKVVYLDVEVDQSIIEADHEPYRSSASEGIHEFINKDGENHLIIPVGLVNLNHDDEYVYTDKINHKTFARTKRIEKGSAINREYEENVLESYERNTANNITSDTDRDRKGDKGFDRDAERKATDSSLNRSGNSGDSYKDEDFYKRKEFDDSNYQNKR